MVPSTACRAGGVSTHRATRCGPARATFLLDLANIRIGWMRGEQDKAPQRWRIAKFLRISATVDMDEKPTQTFA
jgi:hypothetical protein